jgi:cyclopropane fatty-acyl-phospholipid synthase-like methyltransferase
MARSLPQFDRVAAIYAPVERLTFGGALMRRRLQFTGDLADAHRVLVLGDGDGRFSAALVTRFPGIDLTAVDGSAAMLARLEGRVRARAPGVHLETVCQDARDFVPDPRGYDAVVTHFFFDCFTTAEVAALVARIAAVLPPGARWVVSEFAIPTGGAGLFARALVRALYLAFRVLTGLRITRLPDHRSALTAASFVCTDVQTGLAGTLRSELWTSVRR